MRYYMIVYIKDGNILCIDNSDIKFISYDLLEEERVIDFEFFMETLEKRYFKINVIQNIDWQELTKQNHLKLI